MNKTSLKIVSVILLALIISGCSSDKKEESKKAERTKNTVVTSMTTIESDPVGKLIITEVPSEFKVMDDVYGDTGPSDLDKAVRDDSPDADEKTRQLFVDEGFIHGYQRLWQTSDDNQQIIVFIYEFKTAEGAKSFSTRDKDKAIKFDDEHDYKYETSTYDEIPDSQVITGSSQSNGFGGVAVTFNKGKYAGQVVVNASLDVKDPFYLSIAKNLAIELYNKV